MSRDIRSLKSTNLHPRNSQLRPSDIPTPHSVCWRLQLLTCQLGLSHNISWWCDHGLLSNSQKPSTAVQPKKSRQRLLSPIELWFQPRPGLREFRPAQPTAWQTCSGTFTRSQHRPAATTPLRLVVPAYSHLVKSWNIRKADWNRVGLLTEESNQRLPLLDTTNIEKAYQELCESLVYSAKQCVPNGHRKNYVSSSEKEFKILYRSLVRILVETDSDKATSSLLTRLGRKMHLRWEKTVNSINFSHSCCNALSNINKRTCKSENPSGLCPVSANTIASQIVRKG